MAETRAGLAKFCFRQLPRTSNTCVDGRWKMGIEKLLGGKTKIWAKWQKQGRDWPNFASVSFRGRPTHVWTGDGGWKDGNYKREGRKWDKFQKQGRRWPNFASVSFLQLQSASADFRAMYGREVEAIISTKVKASHSG